MVAVHVDVFVMDNHILVDVVVAYHPFYRSCCCCWRDDYHGVGMKGGRNGDEADGMDSLNVVVAFGGGGDPHTSLVPDHLFLLRVVVVGCGKDICCWTVVEIVVAEVVNDDVQVHFPRVDAVVADIVLGIAL